MAKKSEAEIDEFEESEAEATARAVEAAARKKKLLLLVIIGVVLLLVAGGGTWFALRALSGDKAAPTATAAEEHAAPTATETSSGSAQHSTAIYDVFDPAFLANYQVAGRSRYLQVSLAVMAREQGEIDAVHKHMPLLRNRIVMLLSGETFEQLQSDDGRVQLQQKLLAAMQEILQKETGKPQIEQVFFTNFVMQ